jgi:hypothetical protein
MKNLEGSPIEARVAPAVGVALLTLAEEEESRVMLSASWRLERSGREIWFEGERQETRAEAQRREGLRLG